MVMDVEDDISILPRFMDIDEVASSKSKEFRVFFSPPTSPTVTDLVDPGSHHALHQAYSELKKRFNEVSVRNQQLSKKVLELESAKENYDTLASYDMMDDRSFSAQGAAAMPATADAQTAAEEGYVRMLTRELAKCKTQLMNMDKKYQDVFNQKESLIRQLASVSGSTDDEHEARSGPSLLYQNQQLSYQLKEAENRILALISEKENAEKERTELLRTIDQLQVEKDKMIKENDSLNNSLQKANCELAELQERESPELISEVTTLRRVIASLKTMILTQKEYLVQLESRNSMSLNSTGRSIKDVPSVAPSSSSSAGSSGGVGDPARSRNSWELVNRTSMQQKLEMTASQKKRPLSTTHADSYFQVQKPGSLTPLPTAVENNKTIVNNNVSKVPVNGSHNNLQRRSSSEIICRIPEENLTQKRSQTEYIRSTRSPLPQRPVGWVGGKFQQGGIGLNKLQAGFDSSDQNESSDVGYQQQQQQNARISVDSAPSQRGPVIPNPSQQIPYIPVPQSYQHQLSPVRDMASTYDSPSTYDNFPATGRPYDSKSPLANSVDSTISMHIVNPSVMGGGRVVRASVDNNVNVISGMPAANGNKDLGKRGLPQEHLDTTVNNMMAFNLTDLGKDQLSSPTLNVTSENSGSSDGPAADRKCPVCAQDFSHVDMDDFQTHVFECFDDADDSRAPETILPQKKESSERICPMCQQHFARDVPQTYFEQHVQSHFEDLQDHFEVLDFARI